MDSSSRIKRGSGRSHETERILFTVEHANRALPLVRRIVTDIVAQYAKVSEQQERCNRARGKVGVDALHDLKDEYRRAMDKLRDYVEELTELGCELKDYQRGLIDFPAEHDGREVYLCWHLGEDKVEFWHEMDTGFPGRQPLDANF